MEQVCGIPEARSVDNLSLRDELARRRDAVETRIQAACARAGRRREDVLLLAVTKTVPDPVLQLLPDLGLCTLGENRPQELWRKAELLSSRPQVTWHLVGHLQRNKVERTLPLVELIHSVDSQRLLSSLEETAAKQDGNVSVLLEFNTSREASKHGFSPEQLTDLVPALQPLRHVQVCGLMTMAALDADPETSRPCFALLRSLRDRLRPLLTNHHNFLHLSMGMSNDYEVAVEEGATVLRVGSALFAGLSG